MKHRARVINIDDPEGLGRIRVRILSFAKHANQTPWVYPCSPFAGPGYGFFSLPVVGDSVWVEQTAEGLWVYTGFFWTKKNSLPAGASSQRRILSTPAGHTLAFDETGNVELHHASGSAVKLLNDGNIEITAVGEIHLNGSGARVVTTDCICAYTGYKHPQGSLTVKEKGL